MESQSAANASTLKYYARRQASGIDNWQRWPRRLRWQMNVMLGTLGAFVLLGWLGALPKVLIPIMGGLLLVLFLIGQRVVKGRLWPWD